MTAARYPLADLELAVAGRRLSLQEVATLFGTTHRNACRWRSGGLSELLADRLAVAAGIHPGTVWPTWWSLDIETAA